MREICEREESIEDNIFSIFKGARVQNVATYILKIKGNFIKEGGGGTIWGRASGAMCGVICE
jgi:hypothetical protein